MKAKPEFIVPPGQSLELYLGEWLLLWLPLDEVSSQHTKNSRKYARVITTYKSGLKVIVVSSGDGFLRYYSNISPKRAAWHT